MKEKAMPMGPFTIAMLYIGSLIGAGFASGKEIYSYFGAYGGGGRWGILLTTLLFVGLGIVLMQFAVWNKPESYLDLLSFGKPRLRAVIDWCIIVIFATVFMAMLAAGGAVVQQQLGLPPFLGGLAAALLVYAVVLRGIRGIVQVLQFVVPVVLVLALGTAVLLLVSPPGGMGGGAAVRETGFLGSWPLSALVYLSYNFIGSIPILSAAGSRTATSRRAVAGGVLGGLGLGFSAFLLYQALSLDPGAAEAYPMPMLHFAGEISPLIQGLYTVAMLLAIFCAAINSLYVVAGRIPDAPWGKKAAVLGGVCAACYGLSLMGFTNVVERVYPLQGLFGFGVIALLVAGFVSECRRRRGSRPVPESDTAPAE